MRGVGLSVLAGLLLGGVLAGCSSSRPPEAIAADRARVLGTWTYRTDGVGRLERGTLQIRVKDGRLLGRLQDQWRGTVTARVRLQGRHMELALNEVHITGRVHRDRFEGAVRRSYWDVSQDGNRRASTGYFVARRVRRAEATATREDLGCPALLYERSFRCSALPPQ
jgi:hypothetical protein